MPYHPELTAQFGVSEVLGVCPFCCKDVETGDQFHDEEIENGHGDEEGGFFNGVAYVHDGCTSKGKQSS